MFAVRYSIQPQEELGYPGFSPGGTVKFMVSRVKIDLMLLHEEDLLNFIEDLSRRGKPYLSVRSCDVQREGPRRRRHARSRVCARTAWSI